VNVFVRDVELAETPLLGCRKVCSDQNDVTALGQKQPA
jgi:hypothetical protein